MCRLCRTGGVHQVCRLQTVWTLSQLRLFLFFWQTGHDFTWRRAGCFPSCCCSSQGALILRVTMKSRQHFYLFLQFSSHNNLPVITDNNLQLVSMIIRLKTGATKHTKRVKHLKSLRGDGTEPLVSTGRSLGKLWCVRCCSSRFDPQFLVLKSLPVVVWIRKCH